jgi:hypothetical protein
MAWNLSGEYFETCSCTVLCPCIVSQATARPTEGYCDAVMAFHVAQGSADGVDLAGLNAVIALHADGPMADGRGKREIFVDARANSEQRRSLEAIFSGRAGGPPEGVGGLVPELAGVKTADITFRAEGEARFLSVEGFGEQDMQALPGMGGQTLVLTNTGHPASNDLVVGRGGQARFRDDHFDIDNSGKNAHSASFSWSA